MDVSALVEALQELSGSLQRIALALRFLAARMSSTCSDKPVIRVPRALRRFKPEPPTLN